MMEQAPLIDESQRRRAIAARGHAFVWASAGTGKTHTLTLRALHLLLYAPFLPPLRPLTHGNSHLSCIANLYSRENRRLRLQAARATIRSLVLTTFTRKAAAEMQTRLYTYLDSLASAQDLDELGKTSATDPLFRELYRGVLEELREPPDKAFGRLRSGAEALAEMACEFRIATIHSLAASLLQRHPLEAGIPPSLRFAEENEDAPIDFAELLVRKWWQNEALANSELKADLELLLEVLSPYQIRAWFTKVYDVPSILEEIESWTVPAQAEIEALQAACRALQERLAAVRNGRRIAENSDRLHDLVSRWEIGDPQAWPDACYFLWENRQSLFLDGAKTAASVKSAIEQLPLSLSQFFATSSNIYSPCLRMSLMTTWKEQWPVWKKLLRSFQRWTRQEGLAAVGIVSFDEMIRRAADLLETSSAVRDSEQRNLRALLVDEFQDTDPEQLRLLAGLLRKTGDQGHEVVGFFVGDPKQSIYRFRGADVEAVIQFHDRYRELTGARLPVEDLTLSSTFRSLPTVTAFVNQLFGRDLPLTVREEEQLRAVRTGTGKLPEWIWIAPDAEDGKLKAEPARRLAAFETARLIEQYKKEGGQYKDILVLVKTGRELDSLLPVLQECAVPVVSSGARTLYQQPEVLDVLNLLIALHHPLDTLAIGAVLRSPLIQLSDPEIHDLIAQVDARRIIHSPVPLPASLPLAARERLEELQALAASRSNQSLTDWLLSVRRFLPLAAYTEDMDLEGRACARINRLLETFVVELKSGSIAPLAWLLRQRARAGEAGRYDSNLGEDVSVADDSVDAVRAMTIHKAKGLEAPYTIVYGWSSVLQETSDQRNGSGVNGVLSRSAFDDRKIFFSLPFGPITVCSDDLAAALDADKEKDRAEAIRLAYVAATRARDRLSLICTRLPGRFDNLREEAVRFGTEGGATWDGTLWVKASEVIPARSKRTAGPAIEIPHQSYRELWSRRYDQATDGVGFSLARPSVSDYTPRDTDNDGEFDSRTEGARPEVALEAGRLVHSYLERWLRDPEFDSCRLARLATLVGNTAPDAIVLAETSLKLFYSGRLPGPPLFAYHSRARKAQILGHEVPFFLYFQGKFWNGVIDLVMKENGIVVGVDFKTSPEKQELPASYAQQAAVYTEALHQVFPGQAVNFEFWWLLPPDVRL